MSVSFTAKIDDIDYDKETEEFSIYVCYDENGSIYLDIKLKDLQEVLDKAKEIPYKKHFFSDLDKKDNKQLK
jgi:hypothetical protein